jgi:phage tail-like protein
MTDVAAATAARRTGAPFQRLDAHTGWPLAAHPGVLDDGAGLVLGVAGRSPIADTEPFGSFGGRTLPRGLAISADGLILLADPEGREILVGRAGTGAPTLDLGALWPARALPTKDPCDVAPAPQPPADPYVLVRPTDVAFAPSGDLVIADAGAGRLLVLAFPTAALRRVVDLAGGAPSALAFDRRGRCLVADPVAATVHRFDAAWRREPGFPHRSVTLTAPEHVAVARAGDRVVVLDRGRLLGLDGRGRAVPLDPVPELDPPPLRRTSDGALLHEDPAHPHREPLRIDGLPLTRDGRHAGTGLPVVALPRRVEVPRSGRFTTLALDGGRPGFAWDRVVLRARLPAATRLLVSTLTSDSELELDRVLDAAADWSAPLSVAADDVAELLVQSGPGRHLWLQVELFGDGTATPRIEGIDVFGPRRSTLRFLPSSFHTDRESAEFLDRFLSYFDTVFAEITAAHRETATLLDPRAAPDEALTWLGSWFDLHFLAEWAPQVRRRMITEAVDAAGARGTVAGLKRIVQHHTGLADPMPQVIEHFRLPAEPFPVGGEPLDAPQAAHTATLVLPAAAAPDDAARARLEQLVAEHAPAHARILLRLVPAGVTVGRQATVGVDTLLGAPSSGALGEARLGGDLATAPPRPEGLVPAPSLPAPPPHRRSQPCPPTP